MTKSIFRSVRWYTLFVLLSIFCLPKLNGQTATNRNIFEYLSSRTNNGGIVIIKQPEHIMRMVGNYTNKSREATGECVGYRIQVYAGNRPNSKSEAYRRAKLIHQKIQNEAFYVTYKAPFWRLTLGDYISQSEAEIALNAIKDIFPNFSNEMYIVRDKVKTFK